MRRVKPIVRAITYLGHNCFEIRLGNIVSLFSPSVAEQIGQYRRLVKSALVPRNVKECDMIFLPNEEPANCEPETVKEIAERCFSSVIAPKPALSRIDLSERFKIEVHVQDKFTLKGIDVEVIKAIHPQSQYPVGYLLKGDGLSIYYAGDTYSFTDMGRIRCDVAIVPIGGGAVMDPFAASSSVKEMRPKVAIPMGYNTFDKIMQEPNEFADDLGSTTKGVILKVGQQLRL
ncbi:MAG: MBL fold metallo-hydrolase [Candidatus Micrarchaeota archaeon]|nr:MBL fold metallo-hydrolase [Candidatus Micrarchaeota archaeon]